MEKEEKPSVKQEQIHDILFNREIGWQDIIYDLINTEQLDPWDVNITILTEKYLEKIQALEEADFFVSSKVLLAASLLLRIKSEILLNKYIKSIDEILFGKKEEKKATLERIELEDTIPELVPRSPMPRFKKVTLKELIESLNKAINTENRRIKKEIIKKNALRETAISLPKRKLGITDRIKKILGKLVNHFNSNETHKKVTYTKLTEESREERIHSFGPLLQLENQQKIWLHQEEHFGEIHVWEKKNFVHHHGEPFKELKEED
jgi:segregation and condensation protein A